MRFHVLTVVLMKNHTVEVKIFSFHISHNLSVRTDNLQDHKFSQLCCWKIQLPGMWRCIRCLIHVLTITQSWRCYDPLKCQELLTQQHSVTFHKTCIFKWWTDSIIWPNTASCWIQMPVSMTDRSVSQTTCPLHFWHPSFCILPFV